jgi:hypothetical protein
MSDQPRPGVPVPPDEMLYDWYETPGTTTRDNMLSAAAWAADEQLRLCVEWLTTPPIQTLVDLASEMQSAMRPETPKPPTLKEQAISELSDVVQYAKNCGFRIHTDTVLRALETLP